MKYTLMAGVAALALAAAPRVAIAQQNNQPTPPSPSQIQPADQFIKHVAEDDMAEVQLAQLAQQKAQSPKVKRLASRLQADHQKNETKVKQLAKKENVTLPTSVSEKDMALKQDLQGKSGADFDEAYVKAMVQGHQQTIAEFQAAAKAPNDAKLRQFAQQTLPTLKQHLKLAENAQSAVATTGRK